MADPFENARHLSMCTDVCADAFAVEIPNAMQPLSKEM
jgi:hypothetical protein